MFPSSHPASYTGSYTASYRAASRPTTTAEGPTAALDAPCTSVLDPLTDPETFGRWVLGDHRPASCE